MTRFVTCFISCALLLAGLAGCAAPGAGSVGNFSDAPAAVQQQLADAAVKQLLTLYPPGSTRFALQQAASDAFGQSLVAALRAQGYALQDVEASARAPAAAGTTSLPEAPAATGTPLGYVLDQAAGPGLYRISLVLGSQTLTRVYQSHAGQLVPAGAWVRKE